MKQYEKVLESCKRTGLCRNTLMKLARVPGVAVRIGRAVRIDADKLDEAIEKYGQHINDTEDVTMDLNEPSK